VTIGTSTRYCTTSRSVIVVEILGYSSLIINGPRRSRAVWQSSSGWPCRPRRQKHRKEKERVITSTVTRVRMRIVVFVTDGYAYFNYTRFRVARVQLGRAVLDSLVRLIKKIKGWV